VLTRGSQLGRKEYKTVDHPFQLILLPAIYHSLILDSFTQNLNPLQPFFCPIMVLISIKTLILSISAATLATVVVAGPASTGCSDLASKKGTNITYSDVKNCYDSTPFDKAIARSTLETVTTLFDEYYISRDWATAPHLPRPFESDPVDIVAKLKKIGRASYTSDRKFHTDIYKAIESLHDGHAAYGRKCQF